VDAVHPSIARQQPGRRVVNNVKTVGRTPYRIPAGKYDNNAMQQLERIRTAPSRVLFSISVMHTIVTRIGIDCRSRRTVWRMALESRASGTCAADRLLSAASESSVDRQDETLARLDEHALPADQP